jgi:O-antigen/teichoic acid export membrane protein
VRNAVDMVRLAVLNPLVFHAGLYAASSALLKLAGFVFFFWLARTLSVSDYGAWGLLYALQTGVTSFGLVGIVEAVVGLLKEHRSRDEQRRLFAAANGAFLVTAFFSTLLVAILSVGTIDRPGESYLAISGSLASGVLLAYSLLQAQIVRLQERHLASLYFNFVVPVAGLIGSIVAFILARSVTSFFLGSMTGLVIALVGAMAREIGFGGIAHPIAKWRPILSRISPFIAVTMLGWIGGYGNTYIMQWFFGSEEVAKFTFVFMVSSVMQLLASAMNQVWSPRFYRIVHDAPIEQAESKSHIFFRWQAVILGAAGAVVIGLFPAATRVVGGNLIHYQSLGPELLLLVSAYVVVIPYWHCQNYLLAFDQGSSIVKLHVTTGVIGMATLLGLIWLIGPLGIYIGFLVQMALRSAGALTIARAQWPITVSWGGVVGGIALATAGFIVSGGTT